MDEPPHLGDELRAYRKRHKLSRQQLADALSANPRSIASIEQGKQSGKTLRERFQALQASAPPVDGTVPTPDGNVEPEGGGGPFTPLGDLPPLPEPPDSGLDSEGDDLVSVTRGKVSVRSLNHFARLELSMLVFFNGKEIEYNYPTPDGKLAQGYVHQPGVADMLPDPRDGAAIRSQAPEMAHAWAEWARTNSRVNGLLSFFILEGGAKGVIAATLPCVLTIMANHGLDPVGFFLRPAQPEPPAFGEPQGPPPAEDAGVAGTNGDLFDGTPFGFRNADGVDR